MYYIAALVLFLVLWINHWKFNIMKYFFFLYYKSINANFAHAQSIALACEIQSYIELFLEKEEIDSLELKGVYLLYSLFEKKLVGAEKINLHEFLCPFFRQCLFWAECWILWDTNCQLHWKRLQALPGRKMTNLMPDFTI